MGFKRQPIIKKGLIKIPLASGKGEAIIDPEFLWVAKYKWYLGAGGYAVTDVKRKKVLMHRLILGEPIGQVDHINMNPLDNRKTNLRACTSAQNKRNRVKYANNKSGYKGVEILPNGKFRSRIRLDGKNYSGGCFTTAKEAAIAYNKLAQELFGEFARPNVV